MLTIVLWFLFWFKWVTFSQVVKGTVICSILVYFDWLTYWNGIEFWFSNFIVVIGTVPVEHYLVRCAKFVLTVIFG